MLPSTGINIPPVGRFLKLSRSHAEVFLTVNKFDGRWRFAAVLVNIRKTEGNPEPRGRATTPVGPGACRAPGSLPPSGPGVCRANLQSTLPAGSFPAGPAGLSLRPGA